MHLTDKPLAVPPFKSFRYRGRFGWIMIGAMDAEEALREADRSLDYGKAQLENLQEWNGTEYAPPVLGGWPSLRLRADDRA